MKRLEEPKISMHFHITPELLLQIGMFSMQMDRKKVLQKASRSTNNSTNSTKNSPRRRLFHIFLTLPPSAGKNVITCRCAFASKRRKSFEKMFKA